MNKEKVFFDNFRKLNQVPISNFGAYIMFGEIEKVTDITSRKFLVTNYETGKMRLPNGYFLMGDTIVSTQNPDDFYQVVQLETYRRMS